MLSFSPHIALYYIKRNLTLQHASLGDAKREGFNACTEVQTKIRQCRAKL